MVGVTGSIPVVPTTNSLISLHFWNHPRPDRLGHMQYVLDYPAVGDGFIVDALFRYDFQFVVQENGNGNDKGKLDLRITDLVNNVRDIHPIKKREVGERLALWALAKTYGKTDIVYSGPLFKSADFGSGRAVLRSCRGCIACFQPSR